MKSTLRFLTSSQTSGLVILGGEKSEMIKGLDFLFRKASITLVINKTIPCLYQYFGQGIIAHPGYQDNGRL